MINADDIKDMSPTRWVKIPGPGQFRGEGEWKEFDSQYPMSQFTTKEIREATMEEDWQYLVMTSYLPTMVSDEKPTS
jgi:hypothetical protein